MSHDIGKDAAAKTSALLAEVWKRNLPMVRERVAMLERAASDAASGVLSRVLRDEAAATAHKLAGSLGMFGHGEGTRIAREVELLLDAADEVDPQRMSGLVRDLRRSLPL